MRVDEDRCAATILGVAAGDAVGERAFFVARGVRDEDARRVIADEALRIRALGYTDDTAMTLALAEELATGDELDVQRLGQRFAECWQREPWRGYGSGPPLLFERALRTGERFESLARELAGGEGSLGNGAAMRVAPVGLVCGDAGDEEIYERAKRSALPTHAHPQGIDGAAIVARAVVDVVRRGVGERFDAREVLGVLQRFARTTEFRERLSAVDGLLARGATHGEAADALGRGVKAIDSVPFALFAFLRMPAPFAQCVLHAVAEEGDRDTVGAMVGALAGAHAGYDAVRNEAWVAKLENRARIEEVGRALGGARYFAGP